MNRLHGVEMLSKRPTSDTTRYDENDPLVSLPSFIIKWIESFADALEMRSDVMRIDSVGTPPNTRFRYFYTKWIRGFCSNSDV